MFEVEQQEQSICLSTKRIIIWRHRKLTDKKTDIQEIDNCIAGNSNQLDMM